MELKSFCVTYYNMKIKKPGILSYISGREIVDSK